MTTESDLIQEPCEGCKPDPKLFKQAFQELLENAKEFHQLVIGPPDFDFEYLP